MTVTRRNNHTQLFIFLGALFAIFLIACGPSIKSAFAWNPQVCPIENQTQTNVVKVPLEKGMKVGSTIYVSVSVDKLPQPQRVIVLTDDDVKAGYVVIPDVVPGGEHYVEVTVMSKGFTPGSFKGTVSCFTPEIVVPTPQPEQPTTTPVEEQPEQTITPNPTPTRTVVHRATPKVTGGVTTKWLPKRTNGTRGYRMKITGKFSGINLRGHVVKIQFIDILPKGMVGENGAKVISSTPKKVKPGQVVRWNPKFFMTPYALYRNIRNCVQMRVTVDGHVVLTRTACAWTYDPPKVGQPVTYLVWSHGKQVLVTVPDPRLALGA